MRPGAGRAICIGGATVDRKYRSTEPLRLKTSNPVTSERSFGGVARNVAETMARLGADVSFVSMLGDDENGRAVLTHLAHLGVDTRHVAISANRTTAEYVAILQPDGDLAVGLADMAIFDGLGPATIREVWPEAQHSLIFADCNLPSETLRDLIRLTREYDARLAVDVVSVPKATRLPSDLNGVAFLFLNLDEARACLGAPDAAPEEAAKALLACGAGHVVLTLGQDGTIVAERSGVTRVGAAAVRVVDATGAGDALIAATLVAVISGRSLVDAVQIGTMAAALTLECPASVRADLSLPMLEAMASRNNRLAFSPEAL